MNTQVITLGNENNTGNTLLNRMVKSSMPIPNMVSLVSGLIHSCDTGERLDYSDKADLYELGYESTSIIDTLDDYHAMQSLMVYLDEELPTILATNN